MVSQLRPSRWRRPLRMGSFYLLLSSLRHRKNGEIIFDEVVSFKTICEHYSVWTNGAAPLAQRQNSQPRYVFIALLVCLRLMSSEVQRSANGCWRFASLELLWLLVRSQARCFSSPHYEIIMSLLYFSARLTVLVKLFQTSWSCCVVIVKPYLNSDPAALARKNWTSKKPPWRHHEMSQFCFSSLTFLDFSKEGRFQ